MSRTGGKCADMMASISGGILVRRSCDVHNCAACAFLRVNLQVLGHVPGVTGRMAPEKSFDFLIREIETPPLGRGAESECVRIGFSSCVCGNV